MVDYSIFQKAKVAKERQDISYDAYIKGHQDAEDELEKEMCHTGYMKVV